VSFVAVFFSHPEFPERKLILPHCNRFVNFFFFNPDSLYEIFCEYLFSFV